MSAIEFSADISDAVRHLADCAHPAPQVAGDYCTRCGSQMLRGTGWTPPVLLANLRGALDGHLARANRRAEAIVRGHVRPREGAGK